jgi:hypothetical protein
MNPATILLLFALEVATFGPGNRFRLEQSEDDFGMRSHGVIEALGANRTKFYPLPQSSAQDYARLRPEDLRINPFSATADHYDRQEVIGPYRIEDGKILKTEKIWFGNNYYDGEGSRGVGAFGYFDTATRSYMLFSPPEVARYEISAIEVQPDVVWLALDRFGEDVSTSPGGLVRWNRTTHEVHQYPLQFVVSGIGVQGDKLSLKTRNGYVLFRDGHIFTPAK